MHDKVVIRYLGCIGIATSMRGLTKHLRCMLTEESINRLCIANYIDRGTDEKPQHDPINQMLDKEPNLAQSGKHVELCITPKYLNVIDKESKEIIVQHEMPNVSFASIADRCDFVAYVGKNNEYKRACFVLQCSPDSGKDIFDRIHRAFKLRTQQIKTSRNNTNTLIEKSPTLSQVSFNGTLSNVSFHAADANDTSLDAPNKGADEKFVQNEALIAETRASLEGEPWFHGSYLSREESETRLKVDGDFLVRESMLDPGHFVLSVMNNGAKLHLLFDSIGQVRTKELVFDNISQLVSYHHTQRTPIVADNRVVLLENGVRPSPRVGKNLSLP